MPKDVNPAGPSGELRDEAGMCMHTSVCLRVHVCILLKQQVSTIRIHIYSETSIHCFRQGSEKETMDPGKQ
jgi:hypothetical protein